MWLDSRQKQQYEALSIDVVSEIGDKNCSVWIQV